MQSNLMYIQNSKLNLAKPKLSWDIKIDEHNIRKERFPFGCNGKADGSHTPDMLMPTYWRYAQQK